MQLQDFFTYQLKALTRHGVHSPFIYVLQDQVFLDKTNYPVYANGEALLRKLKSDKTIICLTDLGAGSKKPAKVKTVGQIAQQATQQKKYRELLFRMVKWYQPATVLELGTSLGVTTNYLWAGLPAGAKLFTLEGDPAILAFAKTNTLPANDNLTTVLGNFDDTLPTLLDTLPAVDFVYLDGNHTYDATMRYFNWLLPKLSEQAILVFDDIYWSDGMKKAWQEIIKHPCCQYTADLFQLGLVFFTPAKVKQHFVLRY